MGLNKRKFFFNVLFPIDGRDGKMYSIILTELSINLNSKWSPPWESGTLRKSPLKESSPSGSQRGRGPPALSGRICRFRFRQPHFNSKRSSLSLSTCVCWLARLSGISVPLLFHTPFHDLPSQISCPSKYDPNSCNSWRQEQNRLSS